MEENIYSCEVSIFRCLTYTFIRVWEGKNYIKCWDAIDWKTVLHMINKNIIIKIY